MGKAGIDRLKTGATNISRVPEETASATIGASRVVCSHASRTIRQLRKADLRFHTSPIDLAQAIAVSAQARISDRAVTGATEIGKATTTAATKTTDIARTTATEIGKATTTAATKTTDIARTTATEIGKATTTAASKVGDLSGTAASEISKALGMTAAGLLDHGRTFHANCREPFGSFNRSIQNLEGNGGEWARAAAVAASGALLILQEAVPSFNDLSPVMKAKFATAGLRGYWRPVNVADAFYRSGVPLPVRNLGKDAVLAFVDGKHASHIEAVANAPGRMMDPANIVWEAARDNLARGAANMTPLELAKANALNALHATGIVMTEALQTAVVAGCMGIALEGVVSITENLIYVYKDQITLEQGGRRVLKDVLKKGRAAAIGGAGMTVVVALGAGPALATAAPVLVTVGGVMYVVSAYSRIKTALDSAEEQPDLLPLDPSSQAVGTA